MSWDLNVVGHKSLGPKCLDPNVLDPNVADSGVRTYFKYTLYVVICNRVRNQNKNAQ